jgi:hypothetical protein
LIGRISLKNQKRKILTAWLSGVDHPCEAFKRLIQ